MSFLDWMIMLGGVAGFIGTLTNQKMFFDTERMAPHIERHGERKMRVIVATVYLIFALLGAGLIVFNQAAQ